MNKSTELSIPEQCAIVNRHSGDKPGMTAYSIFKEMMDMSNVNATASRIMDSVSITLRHAINDVR